MLWIGARESLAWYWVSRGRKRENAVCAERGCVSWCNSALAALVCSMCCEARAMSLSQSCWMCGSPCDNHSNSCRGGDDDECSANRHQNSICRWHHLWHESSFLLEPRTLLYQTPHFVLLAVQTISSMRIARDGVRKIPRHMLIRSMTATHVITYRSCITYSVIHRDDTFGQ